MKTSLYRWNIIINLHNSEINFICRFKLLNFSYNYSQCSITEHTFEAHYKRHALDNTETISLLHGSLRDTGRIMHWAFVINLHSNFYDKPVLQNSSTNRDDKNSAFIDIKFYRRHSTVQFYLQTSQVCVIAHIYQKVGHTSLNKVRCFAEMNKKELCHL